MRYIRIPVEASGDISLSWLSIHVSGHPVYKVDNDIYVEEQYVDKIISALVYSGYTHIGQYTYHDEVPDGAAISLSISLIHNNSKKFTVASAIAEFLNIPENKAIDLMEKL